MVRQHSPWEASETLQQAHCFYAQLSNALALMSPGQKLAIVEWFLCCWNYLCRFVVPRSTLKKKFSINVEASKLMSTTLGVIYGCNIVETYSLGPKLLSQNIPHDLHTCGTLFFCSEGEIVVLLRIYLNFRQKFLTLHVDAHKIFLKIFWFRCLSESL